MHFILEIWQHILSLSWDFIVILFDFSESLNEMLGDLFLPCETPEAPKQNFFKNLFGGGTSTLDREELCKQCLK